MKYLINITFLILFVGNAFAQTEQDSIQFASFTTTLLIENHLLALDTNGQLTVWDLETLSKVHQQQSDYSKYSTLAKDKNEKIFIGTHQGEIFEFKLLDYSSSLYLKIKRSKSPKTNYLNSIKHIFFNSENEIFLIIPYGVYDPIYDKYWDKFPRYELEGLGFVPVVKKRFLFFKPKVKYHFHLPQLTYLDNQDVIWMAKNYGEFGTMLHLFDTRKRKPLDIEFDSLNMGLFHPQSFFEVGNDLYATSGLQHFMVSGDIFKINGKKVTNLYDSRTFEDTVSVSYESDTLITNDTTIIFKDTIHLVKEGLFIGPGCYHSKEHKIYFSTHRGIFRCNVLKNGKIEKIEFVFNPVLHWTNEPLAIGASMPIKKMEFTKDNRLIFLTKLNGIGIFDGEKTIFLK